MMNLCSVEEGKVLIDACHLKSIKIIDIRDQDKLIQEGVLIKGGCGIHSLPSGEQFDRLEVSAEGYFLRFAFVKPRGQIQPYSELHIQVKRDDNLSNLHCYSLHELLARIDEVCCDLRDNYGIEIDLGAAKNKKIELAVTFPLTKDEIENQKALQMFADRCGTGTACSFHEINNSCEINRYEKNLKCYYMKISKSIEIKLYDKTAALKTMGKVNWPFEFSLYRFEISISNEALQQLTGYRSILDCANENVLKDVYLQLVQGVIENIKKFQKERTQYLISILESSFCEDSKDYPEVVMSKILDYQNEHNSTLLLNQDSLFYAVSQSSLAKIDGKYNAEKCRQVKDRFKTIFKRNGSIRWFDEKTDPFMLLMRKISLGEGAE